MRILPAEEGVVSEAVAVLRSGGVIIFPTETVYGIGADIRQPTAIEKIFVLKQRPLNLRLLVHCADEQQLKFVAREVPESARRLIAAFLPGPLAIILKRSAIVPDIVTAGGETVGIRIVANPVFQAIARRLGAPLAGTSANPSGQPATNNFALIAPEIVQGCDLAIDAGNCGSGIPSTIVDLTCQPPAIHRTGEIGIEQVQAVLGHQ
ncbi:MAG: L-threonylcarbamoyladenylate synthase [candidate division WOR-3 bacterium]|jgi:L-threonylcarbamoyladenylate synthase